MEENIEVITSWPPESEICENTETDDPTDFQHMRQKQNSASEPHRTLKHGLENDGLKTVDMAEVGLAKWWRRKQNKHMDIPMSCNPQTIIQHIAKTEDAKIFMKEQVKKLEKSLICETNILRRRKILAALASYHETSGDFKSAKKYITEALCSESRDHNEDEETKQYKWLKHKIMKECEIKEQQNIYSQKINDFTSLHTPDYTSVERRCANELSVSEFNEKYSCVHKPVIITGLIDEMTTCPWSLQHIREKAGNSRVNVKKLQPDSMEWARLEPSGQVSVAEFIDSLDEQAALKDTDKSYLFDLSVPIHWPELAKEIVIPKYFANDFLQRTPSSSLYHDSWPSLFIAPAGIRSELHVDAFASNFWMALFEGRKRWVFFCKEDTALLYPKYSHSMDPVFEVDLGNPDFEKHPLLTLTHPVECILEPGEVLFVPSGCPHRVENLEKSLAISANFVDRSNFTQVKEQIAINSLIDERSQDLINQFRRDSFDCTMYEDIQHSPLAKLKNDGL